MEYMKNLIKKYKNDEYVYDPTSYLFVDILRRY